MGFFDQQSTIEQAFLTAWTYTPVAKDNVSFEPQTLSEYVRLTDLNAYGRRASLGNNPLYRYGGMVVVQIFTKLNTGSARAKVLADLVTPIFRDRRIGDVQFFVPAVTRVGPRDGWYQVNVDCPYYRDED